MVLFTWGFVLGFATKLHQIVQTVLENGRGHAFLVSPLMCMQYRTSYFALVSWKSCSDEYLLCVA